MKKEAEGMLGVPDGWGEYFTPFGFGTRRRNNSKWKIWVWFVQKGALKSVFRSNCYGSFIGSMITFFSAENSLFGPKETHFISFVLCERSIANTK
jgi:hypothetical protein